MNSLKNFLIPFIISFTMFLLIVFIYYPILTTKNLIFPYAIHPFDIVNKYPTLWKYIKTIYLITSFFSVYIITNSAFKYFLFKYSKKGKKEKLNSNILENSNLNLFVGYDYKTNKKIYIPEKGLYQNILVTGTIGSR